MPAPFMRFVRQRAWLAALLLAASLLAVKEANAYGGRYGVAPSPYTHSAAPYAGRVNHAHLAPQFRWGWFGAERYHPRVAWHRDYNGEVMRWAEHRRY